MIRIVSLLLLLACHVQPETVPVETEGIKTLNEVKNLEIFGDLVTILEKNVTEPAPDGDLFEGYIRNHLLRIKSPLEEEKYFEFGLDRLIPGDETEGRQKKRKGPIRDLLIPILLMIKHKLSVALPLFLAAVTFVAFKAFWAGMTGLVISKVIGLKLLLQSKQEEEKEDNNHQEDDQEPNDQDDEKPIVVYLHSHNQRRRTSNRRHRPPRRHYYGPEDWDPWGWKRDYEKANWDGNRFN